MRHFMQTIADTLKINLLNTQTSSTSRCFALWPSTGGFALGHPLGPHPLTPIIGSRSRARYGCVLLKILRIGPRVCDNLIVENYIFVSYCETQSEIWTYIGGKLLTACLQISKLATPKQSIFQLNLTKYMQLSLVELTCDWFLALTGW